MSRKMFNTKRVHRNRNLSLYYVFRTNPLYSELPAGGGGALNLSKQYKTVCNENNETEVSHYMRSNAVTN
jgi:hypothetical protein